MIFLGCIFFLVNIQFDEKYDIWSSEAHLHLQMQIAVQFKLESKALRGWKRRGTNTYNQNPALIAPACLTRSQNKAFQSGSKGFLKMSEAEKPKGGDSFLFCLAT